MSNLPNAIKSTEFYVANLLLTDHPWNEINWFLKPGGPGTQVVFSTVFTDLLNLDNILYTSRTCDDPAVKNFAQ